MIYSNLSLEKKKIERSDWGTVSYRFEMGESGRGRKLLVLPCFDSDPDIVQGENPGLILGVTKTGRPRVSKGTTGTFLLLSSYGYYTKYCNGWLQCSNPDAVRTLATGNGAEGIAGRCQQWEDAAIQVLADCVLKVKPAGGGETKQRTKYYVVRNSKVFAATGADALADLRDQFDLEDLFENVKWQDLPPVQKLEPGTK